MSDSRGDQEATESVPEKPLDETTPPMKRQQRSLAPSDLEPLDEKLGARESSKGSPHRSS